MDEVLQENKDKLIKKSQHVNEKWLNEQLAWCVEKIKTNMARFKEEFPSACGVNQKYVVKPNDDWTDGFWTAMLWMAYEITKEDSFKELAEKNVASFRERLKNHIVLDHHDIGFLYSLSVGAGYRLLQKEEDKELLVAAADVLLKRFQEKGNFIQAWGKVGDPKEYRLIIDSLMNLPLLFAASKLTGNPRYEEVAKKHYHSLINTVVKPDGTTFHTYYFDLETGEPTYGKTAQGNSDDSIWARGQSWGVLGIPLNENLLGHKEYPSNYQSIADAFLKYLPEDLVPYWDFDFNDENPSDKDSSALAIVACGLLEAGNIHYEHAKEIATGAIYVLGENYTTKNDPENEGLLAHGVYAFKEGKGVDEPNLWGDYFYMEALMRLKNSNWKPYWYEVKE